MKLNLQQMLFIQNDVNSVIRFSIRVSLHYVILTVVSSGWWVMFTIFGISQDINNESILAL